MQSSRMARLLLILTFSSTYVVSQHRPDDYQGAVPYQIRVAVDEVSVTFHAFDSQGLPVNDLNLNEVRLLDNARPPLKILAFQFLKDFPIRAGILMDISESMQAVRSQNRAIAVEYARSVLRQRSDQAFVMNFGSLSPVSQTWTSDPSALTEGIRNRNITAMAGNRTDRTVLLDALYRACSKEFGPTNKASSANFIMLFSDGEDTASQASLRQVIDACQRSNTAIYAFRSPDLTGLDGAITLGRLASGTGGRVFNKDDSGGTTRDLRLIETDLRNQYRIIYKPADLKPDGSFHKVELKGSGRVVDIATRSGYYAPNR